MNETIAIYHMNPAEDRIIFGNDLEDGMWVLAENLGARFPSGRSEDEEIRAQRFRQVTHLHRVPPASNGPPERIVFYRRVG